MIKQTTETLNDIEILYFKERFEEKTALNDIQSELSDKSSESENNKKRKYLIINLISLNKFLNFLELKTLTII